MTGSVMADPGGTKFPDVSSVLAYMDDYESAKDTRLSPGQRRAACAAAVYVLAYTARCEHCLPLGVSPDQIRMQPDSVWQTRAAELLGER